MEMAATQYPGVWRLRTGGFFIRGRATVAATGKATEVERVLRDVSDAAEALATLRQEVRRAETGTPLTTASRPKFGTFAVDLFARKVKLGEIRSAKGREKWGVALEHHLVPAFGDFYVDAIRKGDVEAWKDRISDWIRDGRLVDGERKKYSPHTANGWLSILQVIINTAVADLELERNPMLGVKPFDTSTHRTYTVEEPNSLKPEDVPRFLEWVRLYYPQHYAFVLLGICTGWRPSMLRPLRRKGIESDVKWDEGVLLARRSHTMGDEVMDRTKTAKDQEIGLPPELLSVLRWHVDHLSDAQRRMLGDPERENDLLFPSDLGGFRSHSCLDKMFAAASVQLPDDVPETERQKYLALPYQITPKAMRRTFQDLCRKAEVKDLVQRAICGHETSKMTARYSTVAVEETRAGMAKVISMVGLGRRRKRTG
jgi:integrase